MSSSMAILRRLMKSKASQFTPPPPPDRSNSAASFSSPEIPVKPTVNIPHVAFPYDTQVSWPPNNNSKPVQSGPAIQPQLPPVNSNAPVPVAVKPEPPSQLTHPESLIPARRPSTSSAPNLIHIPIDSSPAFDDELFRWQSDRGGGGKSDIKSPKLFPASGVMSSSPDNLKAFDQSFTIPVGEHLKNNRRPSSPFSSEASSLYSYVSAPELECGDDDLYGYSSPRSYRLTRKDSTTLPQDLVWQVIYGPRGRDDEDDKRSRRSSTGKRSAKSRRNSDGGASIHTARRSKSRSKISADATTIEGGRSHSRSRALKSKHPRNSSTSMSSSALHSVTSSTPSTVSGFTVVNGTRVGMFPPPPEPMPAHAVKAVQAAQASVNKGITSGNTGTQSSDAAASRTKTNHSNSPRNDVNAVPPLPETHISAIGKSYPNYSVTANNPLRSDSGPRSSSMEYLDSPSGEKVTLAAVLEGYNLPRAMKGRRRSNTHQPHVYANFEQSSNNVSSRNDALPMVPRDPPPEGSLPSPPLRPSGGIKPRGDSDKKKNSPVLPIPTSHEKSRSDSLHPGPPDRNYHERGRSNPGHTSQTSTTSPSPSRPLPVRPMAASVFPVAGSSKSANKVEAYPSSSDQTSRRTIHSDRTIKPIPQVKVRSDQSLSKTPYDTLTDVVSPSSKQDKPIPQSRPPVEEKSQGIGNKREDPGIKTASMSGGETTLPTLTIPSSAIRQMTPVSTSSAQTTGTSPSSSLPSFSGNATSVSSVDQSTQKPVDLIQQEETYTMTIALKSVSDSEPPTETKVSENKENQDTQHIDNLYAIPDQPSTSEDLSRRDDDSEIPESTAIPETRSYTDETRNGAQVIDDAVVSNINDDSLNTTKTESPVESDLLAKDNGVEVSRKDNIIHDARLRETSNDSHGSFPPEVLSSVRDDKDSWNLVSLNTSDLTVKEDSPTRNINVSASPAKRQDVNLSNNPLGRSIHDTSVVSIPWNASTGSIGSHRFKDSYYSNHNASLSASSFPHEDAKSLRRWHVAVDPSQTHGFVEDPNENQSINSIPPSLRPEHCPLPPSSSSMELHCQLDDRKTQNDGRTSSPNVWRNRPFSPESARFFPVRHEQNPSVGDMSQAASGISADAVKVSASLPNQRPSSRTSSAFMSASGMSSTRINRSSTLPTVDGVSPAPVPIQSNRHSKTTLPIGNKSIAVHDTIHPTRQRSGSEPYHPSVLHYRAAGRLSTIQQSPVQTTRPAPLPLRNERSVGSMTFPETPYEYTPIPTPGVPIPRTRGASFLSSQPRKASRLGTEFSPRRPAGPRPQRNLGSTKNASSKVASPPNTPRSFDLEPGSDGGILPDFRMRPIEWRAYTLEAAQWTFTSEQLQEIVGHAIQQSSIASTIRLLTLDVLAEIRPEIERLEILQQDITIRYCANVTRRRVILKSLRHNVNNDDWAKRSQLIQELNDTSYLADQLTKDLFHTMHRLQRLHRLMDVHTSSALAMAVRKLNSSFVKQIDDMTHMCQYLTQIEEEKEEAWATAESLEREVMELRDKLEAMSVGTPISDDSSRRNSRKRSVRASKASYRLSRSTRLSHSSTSSNYVFASPPPVPPIPRLAQAPNSRILSLNTDVSLGNHSAQSAHSFAMSPTPESRALAQAQKELYDLLGFSAGPRKSVLPKRPLSEILSPVTASEAYMSPKDHHPNMTSLLRRNNSIPMSPYIISQNFRE
ncbi:hypothetical protein Clacol_008957 [Clathrus columnatus]|uniref:Uncharacterized protein n=1 Tax=Clathrus columnatus TaxID=1419009 RepID=A0AAV5APD3_9AGAM|nr:hypothetical protein Clacol_008957 [Clathrus columnatus]